MNRVKMLCIAMGVGFVGFSQTFNQNSWSYNISLGGSSLLGDLGGNAGDGTTGPKDVDLRAVRPALGVGATYHTRGISFGSNFLFTRLVGDDAFTNVAGRAERNLSVRTDLVELNVIAEAHPFGNTPVLKNIYFTGGIGGIFFQPKAKYNDEWVKLRPLGTEGQTFLDGEEPYNKFEVVIPYGVGYKFKVGDRTTLNLDVTVRKTFTDYLDDVSTVYADNGALDESSGDIAAILADRSGLNFAAGAIRANSEKNDSYFIVGLKFERTIGKSSSSCFYDDQPKSTRRRIKKRQRNMFAR